MSAEQEAAAKWGMFEQYKKLKGERAVIKQQITLMAQSLERIQQTLSGLPPSPVNMIIFDQYPSRDDVTRAAQQYWSLTNQINSLKQNLAQAGMDNLE